MMRKLLAMFALGVMLLAVAPAAEADGRRGHRGGGRGFVVRPFPLPHVHFGFGGHSYRGGYYGRYYGGYPYQYPYAYPYPYAYYPPTVYTAPPPVVYAPPPAATPAPEPEIQREVIYPHGKYVLEGDGVSAAYRWTWIPSATPPPPPAEPATPQPEAEKPKS
jgi:hypothetical protein